jgi:hypothetical protein
MVEPVGRDYNRRLSADDARDVLCATSGRELPGSEEGAAQLDAWIRNGSGFGSAPRSPAELYSNATAAHGSVGGRSSVDRIAVSNAEADNLIRGLAAARHAVSAEEFHRFVSRNDAALTELLRPFGYQGCRSTAQAAIADFDGSYSVWSARNADKVPSSMPSVGLPPMRDSVEEDAAARQRMWHAAVTDPIAAAFVGAGALVSATVGRLFGFEQDPYRAAAGGQMTSILVHTAGGAGANRAVDREPVPIELQRAAARGVFGASSVIVRGGGLDAHEAAGGHLIAKHIGQPLFVLRARLATEPRIDEASTFVSRAEAEAAMSSVMALRSVDIQAWVAKGAKGVQPFDGAFTGGSVLLRGASATIVGSQARVVLQGNGRGDFFILTGYALP